MGCQSYKDGLSHLGADGWVAWSQLLSENCKVIPAMANPNESVSN